MGLHWDSPSHLPTAPGLFFSTLAQSKHGHPLELEIPPPAAVEMYPKGLTGRLAPQLGLIAGLVRAGQIRAQRWLPERPLLQQTVKELGRKLDFQRGSECGFGRNPQKSKNNGCPSAWQKR
ncbi:unnamed protein product [Eretmochelys imbricata]